ncbi:sigma 54-interacting transcriptional regulator [Anaerovorax odorimutans]|uniref:Sigma 54-interacting transcriptional regulator n=1 Tax=Anaerovorax odorimutans TaxID=109327 RepID=A0ABT1RK50_9FIRM|nr:sigma 54-interacting transcriptional regulator [Anaerovorax odorimutans]MCQ4635550.1 sigma 54-interacting transcriptional regulator [Anaerovorax odorimutans]
MYKKFIKDNYNALLDILNCLKVGVYITDGKGNTLFLNNESCKTGGLTRGEVLGKNMKELEEMGFIADSITLKTLESGKEEEIIQSLGDGDQVYVTGTPLYRDGKIELVICTERDITETLTLKELLKEKDKDHVKIKEEIEYLKRQNIIMWGNMIAEDEESKLLAEKAMRIAKLDATVLLTGESGTGKEVFANFIYENSKRVGKPFIKVNCAAIPENLMESELFGYESGAFTGADKNGKMGLFEMANNGTLFLDEIGEMPIHLQSKLLRVLQEREIMRVGGSKTIPLDIRLIVATNRDLKKAIEEGTFRGDLYYRLNIMPLELLPLRGRKKDIKALTLYFVRQFNQKYKLNKSIAKEAVEVLQRFQWPGNIRELENVIERIMISFDGDRITKFQVERAIGIPIETTATTEVVTGDKSMEELLEEYEKYILESMMNKCKRASDVARALKMNKSTLSRRLKKYHIE